MELRIPEGAMMSITAIIAAAETLGLLGRLIYDVAKWVREDTTEAENNREIPKGKKHEVVKQGIHHKVLNYDLRDEHMILPDEDVAKAKAEALKHVDRYIKETVDIKHRTGEFVR
jgi:hypothetical protein